MGPSAITTAIVERAGSLVRIDVHPTSMSPREPPAVAMHMMPPRFPPMPPPEPSWQAEEAQPELGRSMTLAAQAAAGGHRAQMQQHFEADAQQPLQPPTGEGCHSVLGRAQGGRPRFAAHKLTPAAPRCTNGLLCRAAQCHGGHAGCGSRRSATCAWACTWDAKLRFSAG